MMKTQRERDMMKTQRERHDDDTVTILAKHEVNLK